MKMINFVEYISYLLIPILIVFVIGMSAKTKISVYDTFIEGVKESFSVILNIFPSMLAILLMINLFKVSRWNEFPCKDTNANIFND